MSSSANFKTFSGKGTAIGGTPVVAAPRISSNGSSASRARSTPETRSAAQAAQGHINTSPSRERQGSALIAKLEEKKRTESLGNSFALTSTDVGHEMNSDSISIVHNIDDKEATAIYGKVNETEDSV